MIARVVGNWLTNTTEREYQLPFCQLLSSKGHRVLHVSTHGQGERGKDIVTQDRSGHICGYQLKTGNIGVPEWRGIRGEIDDLTTLKISLPNVPSKRNWHQSFLVTNGRFTAEVKQNIQIYNVSHRTAASNLNIIEYDEMLGDFIGIHGDFLPTEIADTKRFLELVLADGTGVLPAGDISKLLVSILPLGEIHKKPAKSVCRRSLASALLMASYVSQQYVQAQNHFALIELWVIFCMHALAVVERFSLEEQHWKETFDLALTAIDIALADAVDELSGRSAEIYQLSEGDFLTDFVCLRARLTHVMGYLAAHALYRKIRGDEGWQSEALDKLIDKHSDIALRFRPDHPYGEAAIPHLLAVAWYMEYTGRIAQASSTVGSLLHVILLMQKRDGMPKPYYNAEACMRHHLGIERIDEAFARHSYSIRSLVEWLARRFWRQHIAASWCAISHIQCCEFVPEKKWGYYLWSCDEGDEQTRFPNQQQSWRELRRDYPSDVFPNTMRQIPAMLPLFLVAYPHRLTPAFTWRMDSLLRRIFD